jgi:hypothetical protein
VEIRRGTIPSHSRACVAETSSSHATDDLCGRPGSVPRGTGIAMVTCWGTWDTVARWSRLGWCESSQFHEFSHAAVTACLATLQLILQLSIILPIRLTPASPPPTSDFKFSHYHPTCRTAGFGLIRCPSLCKALRSGAHRQ